MGKRSDKRRRLQAEGQQAVSSLDLRLSRKQQRQHLAALDLSARDLELIHAAKAAVSEVQGKRRPAGGEVVDPKSDMYELGQAFVDVLVNPDPNVSRLKSKDPKYYKGPYSQYEEPLDSHAHLAACWEQRGNRGLSKPRSYHSADDSPEARELAAFVNAVLEDKLTGWRHGLHELLMAAHYGFAAPEVVWPVDLSERTTVTFEVQGPEDDEGYGGESESHSLEALIPDYMIGRHPRAFVFNAKRELRRLTLEQPLEGVAVPPFSFIVHTPDPRFGNSYGAGRARVAHWWADFSSKGMKWWLIFTEKLSTGTPVLTYPANTSEADQKYYESLVTSIQQETGLTVPAGVEIELLELASKAGTTNNHETLQRFCNAQISKLILGQTLTIEQGDTGARSMAEVHLEILDSIIREDLTALAETINRTIIPWLVEVNFGADQLHLCPRICFETERADIKLSLDKYKAAYDMGIPFSRRAFREDVGLSAPRGKKDEVRRQDPAAPEGAPGAKTNPAKPDEAKGGGNAAAARRAVNQTDKRLAGTEIRLHLYAAAESIPDDELRRILAEGIQLAAALSGQIPEILKAALLAYASELIGPDGASKPVPEGMRQLAQQFSVPDHLKAALIEQINNDMTLSGIIGAGKLADAMRAAGLDLPIPDGNLLPLPNALNAVWDELSGGKEAGYGQRFIPQRALRAFQQRAATVLESDEFYRLDGLCRASSFEVFDILEDDIRGYVTGFVEDAIREGHTVQQFADRVYAESRLRYVVEGTELHAWHIETIYNTNIATAFNQAEADALWANQDILDHFRVINPDPQHPRCKAMAGKVYPTRMLLAVGCPPWHFNCGTTIAAMHGNGGFEVQTGPPLDETGQEILPENFPGPRNKITGKREGVGALFGQWAPPDRRMAHMQQKLAELRSGT